MSTPTPGSKIAPSRPQQRLPAPSLFVGPSSRNTSSADLRGQASTQGASTVSKQRSFLNAQLDGTRSEAAEDDAVNSVDHANPTDTLRTPPSRHEHQERGKETEAKRQSKPSEQRQPRQEQNQQPQAQQQRNATDKDPVTSSWLTMRNTLAEVDNAAASGATVFSAAHARALEDLRKAQIALAQAWGRSEAEDEAQVEGTEAEAENRAKGLDGLAGENALIGGKTSGVLENTVKGDAARPGVGASAGGKTTAASDAEERNAKSQLEEETENDIRLARKRRLANDRYFERVNKGVVDVVAKLEEVAAKMKSIEMESKEIWGDDNSLNSE